MTDPMRERWRLVLGDAAQDSLGGLSAEAAGRDATLTMELALSHHPAGPGRPAGQLVLRYRLGGVDTVRHTVDGRHGTVELPAPAGAWRRHTFDLLADVRRLWPDIVAGDNSLRGLRLKDAGVLLALAGPLLYMAFLWHSEGTPMAFADAESAPGWGHEPGPRTWFKLSLLNGLREYGLVRETAGSLLHGFIAVGALLLIPRVIRRFGWGYGAFCLVVVGIPIISSKDFYGLGRYLLAAFPVVAVAAEWLVDRPVWARAAIWSVSGALLAFISYSYARGLYVA